MVFLVDRAVVLEDQDKEQIKPPTPPLNLVVVTPPVIILANQTLSLVITTSKIILVAVVVEPEMLVGVQYPEMLNGEALLAEEGHLAMVAEQVVRFLVVLVVVEVVGPA
jgi:hypothetical protein